MQVHPSQISPSQNFDLFYFIRNPLDGATYYVQAVIYDLRTGAVLATQNLTQSPGNTHLYTATLQAPADSTGYGRSIVAVASVYTDSSYSTISQNYEQQDQYFLIKEDRQYGGGGMNYTSLKRLIESAVEGKLGALPKPAEPAPVDFSQVTGALGAIMREINRIPKDDPETIDLTPLRTKLDDLAALVSAIPTEKDEPLDLTPVMASSTILALDIGHVALGIGLYERGAGSGAARNPRAPRPGDDGNPAARGAGRA